MLNSVMAAQIIVSAWDNWTDETENASDNILQAAVSYAKAILENAPHQIPDAVRQHFANAVLVMQDDPANPNPDRPNLTFDEVVERLRAFIFCYENRPIRK